VPAAAGIHMIQVLSHIIGRKGSVGFSMYFILKGRFKHFFCIKNYRNRIKGVISLVSEPVIRVIRIQETGKANSESRY